MPPIKNITPHDRISIDQKWILRGLVAIILLWGFVSCLAEVPYDSVGVLIRFGAYRATCKPGLNFKLPFGIDQLVIVPVGRLQKLEFGFSTPGATDPEQASEEPDLEQSMVTGDLSMALVQWVVQYKVDDPEKFLFHTRDPKPTLRDACESAMREVIGDRTVDEILTVGRQEVESETLVRLKQLVDLYGLGIAINNVQLKDVHPPEAVQASFNEVNQAQQEREQMINVANGDYNKAVPRARGEAQQKVIEAEGYAVKRKNEAQGAADRFKSQLAEYVKAPEVTRQRLYLEAMAEVLPQIERKVIVDPKSGQMLPLLPLELNPRTSSK